jgi:3-isopropylmalate/(R)-2-methylmalate dehydratase large subunit
MGLTLLDKVWESHVAQRLAGQPDLLYVDLHLVHEVTSPQAFTGLRARGLRVRHPERTVATADHSIPTHPRNLPILDLMAAAESVGGLEYVLIEQEGSKYGEFETAKKCLENWKKMFA